MHPFSLSSSNFWLQISALGGWTTEIVETLTAWLSFSLQRVPQLHAETRLEGKMIILENEENGEKCNVGDSGD